MSRRHPAGRAALAAVLAGCGADPGPFAGRRFYVRPDSPAAREVGQLVASGRTADADRLRTSADRPAAVWFNGQQDDPYDAAGALVRAADQRGQLPVLVVYDVPDRDCGRYSAGGAPDADAYYRYVGSLAAGIGDLPAVVVLEPDAVPLTVQGCSGASPEDRWALLSGAVAILTRRPATRVYLDAGHAGWLPPPQLADALRRSGVARAAGFALNVANFRSTDSSLRYGRAVSDAVDGAHFVVDTSRNGAGPPADDGTDTWCNPPGRRVGAAPTGDTGEERVDAYLWVKDPGASDGSCHPGDPPAGAFWLERALQLAG